jgi:hypothetical protein
MNWLGLILGRISSCWAPGSRVPPAAPCRSAPGTCWRWGRRWRASPVAPPTPAPGADWPRHVGRCLRRPVRGTPAAMRATDDPNPGPALRLQSGGGDAGHQGRTHRRTISSAAPRGVPKVPTTDTGHAGHRGHSDARHHGVAPGRDRRAAATPRCPGGGSRSIRDLTARPADERPIGRHCLAATRGRRRSARRWSPSARWTRAAPTSTTCRRCGRRGCGHRRCRARSRRG